MNNMHVSVIVEAVRHAIAVANPEDIIIFAGKGHEDYQIIGSHKYSAFGCKYCVRRSRKIWIRRR